MYVHGILTRVQHYYLKDSLGNDEHLITAESIGAEFCLKHVIIHLGC